MALPEINVFSVDQENIYLNWKVKDADVVQSYNLYGCATYAGVYTLIQAKVPNTAHPISPSNVLAKVVRATAAIAVDQPYFFKITSINGAGVESNIATSKFISVDSLDDIFKQRVSDDNNPVYKNITLSIPGGTVKQFVDIERILGRDANFVQIRTSLALGVRWNSGFNDPVTIAASSASAPYYQLDKQALLIKSAYIDNPAGGAATVEILVSGN